MAPTIEIESDQHYGVGPLINLYHHELVTQITPQELRPGHGIILLACLDCGYVSDDVRRFQLTDCDRSTNSIGTTWRERVDRDGFPS